MFAFGCTSLKFTFPTLTDLFLCISLHRLMAELDKRGGTSLKGAAIGDGCWGNAVGTCAFASPDSVHTMVEFFAGHGMYPQVCSFFLLLLLMGVFSTIVWLSSHFVFTTRPPFSWRDGARRGKPFCFSRWCCFTVDWVELNASSVMRVFFVSARTAGNHC